MDLKSLSLVPNEYKDKDPRALAYLFPTSLNLVAYAKKMQEFTYYQSLEAAETVAHNLGYILIPWTCIHWRRAAKIAADRKVKIGRKSFYMFKLEEMTKKEKESLLEYLNELHPTERTVQVV